MSEVLYRKWRPRRLDQVVGQEPVTQTLKQAVSLGRVAHAYLFCGPRGTGKTSTARILAKAVNCHSPQDGEPDNECTICRAINEGRALDLIEIDAASNRRIDDIRSLSEKIRFVPSEARYKVYIIDEVHMLTEHAFNALLKTLEEPPAHAIFVLATTEIQEVPSTIISRCQRFDFRRIPVDRMVSNLAEICRGEKIEASEDVLTLISRSARGSLRDAQNLLEQVFVSYGSPVTEEQVRELLGLGGEESALELAGHAIYKSVAEGLTVINQVAGQGDDLRQLYRGLMEFLRAILIVKSRAGAPLGYSGDTSHRLQSLADDVPMDHLLHTIRTFAVVDLRRDSFSPLPLELAMVESSHDPPPQVLDRRPSPAAERRTQGGRGEPAPSRPHQRPPASRRQSDPVRSPVTSSAEPDVRGEPTPPASRRQSDPVRTSATRGVGPDVQGDSPVDLPSEPAARLEAQWGSIIRSLRHTGKRFKLGALLRGCRDRDVSNGVITLRFLYSSHVERMREELSDPSTRDEVKKVLAAAMDAPYEIEASLVSDENNGLKQNAAQRSHLVRAVQAMGGRVVGEKEDDT